MEKKKTYQVNMAKPISFVPALAHLVSRGAKRAKITETLILQQMIDWYIWKIGDIGNKKHQIEMLKKNDSLDEWEQKELEKLRDDVENGEWIWKSSDELANGDFGGTLTIPSVARAFEYLVENGFLWVRTNPKVKMDRTYQYRPRINYIRRELHKMGHALYGFSVWNESEQIEPEQKIFPPSWKGKGKKAKDINEETKSLPKVQKSAQPVDSEEEERIKVITRAFKSAFDGYNLQPVSAKVILKEANGDIEYALSFIKRVSSSKLYKEGNLRNKVGAVVSAIKNGEWDDELNKHEDKLPRSIQEAEKRQRERIEQEKEVNPEAKKRIELSLLMMKANFWARQKQIKGPKEEKVRGFLFNHKFDQETSEWIIRSEKPNDKELEEIEITIQEMHQFIPEKLAT
ncbi:hypothetical protein [Desmospora activa]|uniref:Uncharacterized protein n=1 Tax=Desmospora activa DSM 45169 TaxID=1121389 RepID=A0A2T4YZQ6_9BACL|nr:hypothetical protein [Desmospora activa]PTM52701.1 hypothetical protein C8J48_3694 [Desmospora activa DSM 45169]